MAVGCFVEGGAAGPKETARLALDADGTLSLFVGSASVGQGLETVCLQIAADALDVPMERLRVFHGSTTYLDDGYGAYHSRSVVMGGSAILNAADNLRAAIRTAAGRYLNCAPEEVEIAGESARGPSGRAIAWRELAPLSVDGEFRNSKHTYSYGAHAAHVAVDPRTGAIRVIDYVAVEDAGRIINPLTLHGQSIGAIVQGLGGTLMEHMVYDEAGQLLTASYADYLLPTATDFPLVRGEVLELYPSPINPLGAKGAGEGGTIPVGGVIANAVASALSEFEVEPLALPLSPARVWRLIAAAKANSR
jgi:carbon-monoxide dehydrogenase large subunit